MDPVTGPSFIPSSSPYFEPKGSSTNIGERLFEQTSQFYAWYLSWQQKPTDHRHTFCLLSTLMRLAKTSYEGGHYLTKEDENEALSLLQGLSEHLMEGSHACHEIGDTLETILSFLIDHNPKAKLMANATLLEYKMLIHSEKEVPDTVLAEYQEVFDRLEKEVTPALSNIDAERLSRELAKYLNTSPDHDTVLQGLRNLLQH